MAPMKRMILSIDIVGTFFVAIATKAYEGGPCTYYPEMKHFYQHIMLSTERVRELKD